MSRRSCWALTDIEGNILDQFVTEQEAREATYTGEYPEDAEVAYLSEPIVG
jgi:hypothetical protein